MGPILLLLALLQALAAGARGPLYLPLAHDDEAMISWPCQPIAELCFSYVGLRDGPTLRIGRS